MRGRLINGARLQLLREEADMPREELAEVLGCSPGHLKNVEIGTPPEQPSQLSGRRVFRTAHALSDKLGREVTIDEFTTATDAAFTTPTVGEDEHRAAS